MGPLTSRLALGKDAWNATPSATPTRQTRTIRDSRGRLDEQWLVNGAWVTMKG